jgi:competence protein ComEC
MNRFMFGFCAMSLSAMLWPSLPPLGYLPILLLMALVFITRAPLLAGCLLAMAWLSGFSHFLLHFDGAERPGTLQVRGEIISLVNTNGDWLSADIRVLRPNSTQWVTQKIRLSWRNSQGVVEGQVYDFSLRPKGIASVLNQGGFNQQKYLLSQHIIAKASVVNATLISSAPGLRYGLKQRLSPVLESMATGDILLALLLGDRSAMGTERWRALRNTGTGHLVAISGLHLSVVCAWLYGMTLWLLCRAWPHPGRRNFFIAMGLGCACMLSYAWLAGFAIATQRAAIMISVLVVTSSLRRFSSPWDRLLWALFLVLLFSPLASLSAGFWLSFSALTIILLSLNDIRAAPADGPIGELTYRQSLGRWCAALWAIQWRLSLGIGLLGAMLFGGLSIHSLWVNLLMVPWFSLVVIPLAFLGLLLWLLGMVMGNSFPWLLQLADVSLWPVEKLLNGASELPASWLILTDPLQSALLWALLGTSLLLLFRHCGLLWRLCMASLFLPLLLSLWHWLIPPPSERWQLHLLDVGQGLAAVVEKSGRALVYDTGAAFGEDFNYAQRTLLPFLQARGLRQLDYIIISHGDNDHAGGAKVLLAAYPDAVLISDVPLIAGQIPCRPQRIFWQGLSLEFLGPERPSPGNNGSCVVRIDSGRQSLLLTGDIEKAAEVALLKSRVKLQSNVLIAPHHGSRTSSTHDFIAAVAPELLLVPAGLDNRYGFPKSDVMARYQRLGIPIWVTGEQGQLSVTFGPDDHRLRRFRADLAPFWYNRLFRFGGAAIPE